MATDLTRRSAIALLGGAMALLGGCGRSASSFRYRMTVEGQNPGTAVYEVLAEKVVGPRLSEEKPGGSVIRGEALVIETSSGPVFALLESTGGSDALRVAVVKALAPDAPLQPVESYFDTIRALDAVRDGDAKGDLPRADWPTMIRFRDINDPESMEQVDPVSIGITRISVETTRDPITTGIEKRLRWLNAVEASASTSLFSTSSSELVGQLRSAGH